MKEILICTVLTLLIIWVVLHFLSFKYYGCTPEAFTESHKFYACFSLLILYLCIVRLICGTIPIRWEGILLAALISLICFVRSYLIYRKEKTELQSREAHVTEFIDKDLLKQLLLLNEQENIPNTERDCLCTCPFGNIAKSKQTAGKKIDFETCCEYPQCFQYCNVFKCNIIDIDRICKLFSDDNVTPAKCKLTQLTENAELQKLINELTEEIAKDRASFS